MPKMYLKEGIKKVKIGELSPGHLFSYEGSIVMKSEYRNDKGGCLCYLEETGECFWGGKIELNDLMVTPLYISVE
jgi:hypothetical protein